MVVLDFWIKYINKHLVLLLGMIRLHLMRLSSLVIDCILVFHHWSHYWSHPFIRTIVGWIHLREGRTATMHEASVCIIQWQLFFRSVLTCIVLVFGFISASMQQPLRLSPLLFRDQIVLMCSNTNGTFGCSEIVRVDKLIEVNLIFISFLEELLAILSWSIEFIYWTMTIVPLAWISSFPAVT